MVLTATASYEVDLSSQDSCQFIHPRASAGHSTFGHIEKHPFSLSENLPYFKILRDIPYNFKDTKKINIIIKTFRKFNI